ncbi:MAG: anaerobic ribonucleoside-triphosphate reductase activating protein [Clostridia bacterium]|nr:anaerobic ribonucleoside-triphosphate reductase activating protein [Clostridia bacterium]
MRILGIQKMTLLDYPGNVACTLFTGGCNFRCPFCHNASLVLHAGEAKVIPEEDILSFLSKRTSVLDGVCITGGEPLIHEDIEVFLAKISDLGFKIKLDTNGTFPDRLKSLIEKGLVNRVAMDIKNSKEKYSLTAGIDTDLSVIGRSIEILKSSGIEYEFRTTVVSEYHETSDIEDICRWISGAGEYHIQNFKDSGDVIADGLHGVPRAKLKEFRETAMKYIPMVTVRGEDL